MRFAAIILLMGGLAHGQENWPFLTYIGGSGEDNAHLVTSDALVKTFVAGLTNSVGPPFTDELPRFCFTSPNGSLMKFDAEGLPLRSQVVAAGR